MWLKLWECDTNGEIIGSITINMDNVLWFKRNDVTIIKFIDGETITVIEHPGVIDMFVEPGNEPDV